MTETELPARQAHPQHDVEVGNNASVATVAAEAVLPPMSAADNDLARTAFAGGFLKPVAETTDRERIAGGVGALAVLTALIAVVVEQSAIVLLAGLLSAVVGPYLYHQETRLTDIKTSQETKRATEAEVNRLAQANRELVQNVDDLTRTVDRLQVIEQALSVLHDKSGTTVQEFSQQVEDGKALLKNMKGNLKSSVLQNLLSVILRSDVDRDFVIDETEVTDLIHRISNIAGVRIDETKFRAACRGASVPAIMDMVKNLLRPCGDGATADDCIFSFDHDL